jgi:F0F1-type ATP synthase membrane subunit b/b'
MKKHRVFLIILAAIYILEAAVGLFLFHGPGYSKAYMAAHGREHERYLRISKTPEYQRYKERPHLNPLPAAMKDDGEFAYAYAQRQDFRAERLRIMAYTLWFRVLNAVVVVALTVYFFKRPVLNYLDRQTGAIRDEYAETESILSEARKNQAEAERLHNSWPQKEKEIRLHAELTLKESLAEVERETEFARAQITRDIKNRKDAELIATAHTMKLELINTAIRELEAKYIREASPERLSKNVDLFVLFMGILA